MNLTVEASSQAHAMFRRKGPWLAKQDGLDDEGYFVEVFRDHAY